MATRKTAPPQVFDSRFGKNSGFWNKIMNYLRTSRSRVCCRRCTFCDPHCVGAQHQPQVIAGQNGGATTQFNGPLYSPFSYFTYSNEVDTIIPSDGTPAGPDQTGQVFCTGLATTIIVVGFHPRFAWAWEKTHTTSQSPINVDPPWTCSEEPWCTAATTPPTLNITTFIETKKAQGPIGSDGIRTNGCFRIMFTGEFVNRRRHVGIATM